MKMTLKTKLLLPILLPYTIIKILVIYLIGGGLWIDEET